MPCKRALCSLSFSRLALLSLFLGAGSWRSPAYAGSHGCLAVGFHSSLGPKEYTFRKEKTLSLNRVAIPMLRVYFEAMRMRMTLVGLLHVEVL